MGAPRVCSVCNGMGFVIADVPQGHPRFGKAQPCVCKMAELQERHDAAHKFGQLDILQHQTFDTFIPEGLGLTFEKSRSLRMAYDTSRRFAEHPEGWLLLKGTYGSGKTHLAAAVANHQLQLGYRPIFITVPDLLDHLRGTYRPNSNVTYDDLFEEVRNTPLLILDDLGAHNHSDWAQEKLFQIFNHRYNARLPMVVTTNQDLDMLEERIRSRLSDISFVQMANITAPDFRRGGVNQEESDLSTLHWLSDRIFDSFDFREDELPHALAKNLRNAYNTLRDFAEHPRGWVVLNSSNYGNGKTHLAAAAANAISAQGEMVLFIPVPDLLDHLRATFDPRTGTRLDQRFNQVKSAPVLVLDDLGTESATAWAREKLYQLFNHRYNARLPTIITTTTPIDEIDPRLQSRFLDGDRCTFFMLEAPSYRVRRR